MACRSGLGGRLRRFLSKFRHDGNEGRRRPMRVHHQTVQRCVERTLACGPMVALDDRPRPGKEPTITAAAKAWVVKRSLIARQVFALSRSAAGGVGCSTETGSDAGKVSLRASSSAFSWCMRSRLSRALSSR
jgi:hypothetical protein